MKKLLTIILTISFIATFAQSNLFLPGDEISEMFGIRYLEYLISADFDGDNNTDVLMGTNFGEISLNQNRGNQIFVTGARFLESNQIVAVNVGDMNGNGFPDVITANSGGDIFLYNNNGAWDFDTAQTILSITNVSNVTPFDFDGDGDLDLIIVHNSFTISWIENLGANSFGPLQFFNSLPNQLVSLVIEDLNEDNNLDIVVSTRYAILWYENFGSGSLSAANSIFSGGGTTFFRGDLAIADFDGDLDKDIIMTDGSYLKYWLNDGLENFTLTSSPTGILNSRYTVRARDVDLDGDLDLISAKGFLVVWHENLGAGLFSTTAQTIQSSGASTSAERVWLTEDIDNDGDIDLLTRKKSSTVSPVDWYENDGIGNFINDRTVPSNIMDPSTLGAEDIDNDGDLDFVFSPEVILVL